MTTNAPSNANPPFHHHLHERYIETLKAKIDHPDSYEGAVTEHLRMSGIYWSLTALSLISTPSEVDRRMNLTSTHSSSSNDEEDSEAKIDDTQCILDWVFDCYDKKTGGFGGNVGHDGHILYTLSALQILALADRLSDSRLDIPAVNNFICKLQQPDGSFSGDEWGEVDTRFSYCALSALSLLGTLEGKDGLNASIDIEKAAIFVASCQNFDGGFGMTPGAESHAGQIFCCVGALSICRRLDLLHDADLLCWWLAERQCDSGGLNGRPEKQADVCYSWWILSSLCILGRIDWIRGDKLSSFILKCQDDEDGGIADRPGDMPDVFHTFFGIAGLSLIGHLHGGDIILADGDDGAAATLPNYRKVDPVYALPTDVVQHLSLNGQIMNPGDDRLKQYDVL